MHGQAEIIDRSIDRSINQSINLNRCLFIYQVDVTKTEKDSGVATPGHTRACAHVKFIGAWVRIMYIE